MNDTETETTNDKKSKIDYRTVWRWHFYAGLFCIPFVIVLAVSGSIYLFKPQIEAWLDSPYDNLKISGAVQSTEAQIEAAIKSVPGSKLNAYEIAENESSATRIILAKDRNRIRTYVHPATLEVLHTAPEEERFMRFIRRIHGELLLGPNGSYLVELAACWTIVMILTGLYLWWPRNSNSWGGILFVRMKKGKRILLRDFHSIIGVWISAFVLILLLSGLPWSKFWGGYFRSVRKMTETAVAKQDWSTGNETSTKKKKKKSGGWGNNFDIAENIDYSQIDSILKTVKPLQLKSPVLIYPPKPKSTEWTVKSQTQNRPQRVDMIVEGASGNIVSRTDFKDRHWVDRIVGTGIAIHEGQLFGWFNQFLGVVTTLGLILVSVSGAIMWWKRRDQGVLGAPQVSTNSKVSYSLIAILIVLGIYLPVFGASMLGVLVIEKFVLRKIPGVRHWLGLKSDFKSTI